MVEFKLEAGYVSVDTNEAVAYNTNVIIYIYEMDIEGFKNLT